MPLPRSITVISTPGPEPLVAGAAVNITLPPPGENLTALSTSSSSDNASHRRSPVTGGRLRAPPLEMVCAPVYPSEHPPTTTLTTPRPSKGLAPQQTPPGPPQGANTRI